MRARRGDQRKLAETFQREFDWLKDASDDELVQINEFARLMLGSQEGRDEVPDGDRAVLAMSALFDAVNARMRSQDQASQDT